MLYRAEFDCSVLHPLIAGRLCDPKAPADLQKDRGRCKRADVSPHPSARVRPVDDGDDVLERLARELTW